MVKRFLSSHKKKEKKLGNNLENTTTEVKEDVRLIYFDKLRQQLTENKFN